MPEAHGVENGDEGVEISVVDRGVGMTAQELEDMYRLLAIAKYDDRYVIPKAHTELASRLEAEHAGCSLEGGPMGGDAGGYGSVGYPAQRGPTGRRLNVLGGDK